MGHIRMMNSCKPSLLASFIMNHQVFIWYPVRTGMNCQMFKECERLTRRSNSLSPTHKALKFIPQNESIAHALLTDTTMWVSRIPFGYRPVAQKKDHPFQRSIISEPFNDEPLGNCTDGNGAPPVITPIYARWPVDRSIPDIPHEVLYDIYTPSSGSSIDSLLSSELAPKIQTRGERPDAGFHPAWMDPWGLKIRFYDNVLNAYKNVLYIHVRYMDYYSFYTKTLITNSDGKVDVPVNVPMSAWVFIEFYTNDFKITDNDSANYSIEFIDTVDNLTEYPYTFVLGSPVTTLDYPYSFRRQVFQAARYYYKGKNDLLNNIQKMHLDDPLRIATYPDSTYFHDNEGPYIGEFVGNATPPYIRLCQYDTLATKIFGTAFHELGHASHKTEVGTSFGTTEPRIKESFASFMGWYNVKKYYSTVLTTDSQVHSYCTQGRQTWYGDATNSYTPIYIDMVDDYNQSTILGSYYVNDAISDVPVTDVLSFAIGPVYWWQSEYLMQQQIGVLYSSTDFNNMISLY